MRREKYTKELLAPIVKKSKSFKELMDNLGVRYTITTKNVIWKSLLRNNIDFSHLKMISKTNNSKKTNEELFVLDSERYDNGIIKARIIKYKLIEYKCHYCGCNDQWLGKTMPLILDHINGISNDNRLENLRFLCSNCDSIQPTYKNKNKNKERGRKIKLENINKRRLKLEEKYTEIDFRIYNIKNSNINFQEHGWRLKVAKILNKSPQYCGKFIKENIPELWEECKKHNG